MIKLLVEGMKRISSDNGSFLEQAPISEEVKRAIWSCGVEKSVGYDGFNYRLFRKMWNEIGYEILSFVEDFMMHGKLSKSVNVTLSMFNSKDE